MTDIEDVKGAVTVGLRLGSFIIGCALLVSGFADLGVLSRGDILARIIFRTNSDYQNHSWCNLDACIC